MPYALVILIPILYLIDKIMIESMLELQAPIERELGGKYEYTLYMLNIMQVLFIISCLFCRRKLKKIAEWKRELGQPSK